VVLYTTGVKVVRDTYDKCLRVKKILQTHMVRYEERDISISRDNHRQLAERLGGSSNVDLPQVFADGLHIGVRHNHRRHLSPKCGAYAYPLICINIHPDAVPPIRAVSYHVATDNVPAQNGDRFQSIFSDSLQPIATRGKKARGTLLVDKHCGNGCSIKRAPLSVSY